MSKPQTVEKQPISNANTVNSNAIDCISNKLREGIDEMITNLTIVSNKTVELEKQNTELITKVEETNQLKDEFKKLQDKMLTL